MFSAIKLVITENGKMLESITKDSGTQPSQLIKSLEDFQQSANAVLTKLIDTQGVPDSICDDAEEEDEDEDEDEDEEVSPKKRKK